MVVSFVDIGGVVDPHCLNFCFIAYRQCFFFVIDIDFVIYISRDQLRERDILAEEMMEKRIKIITDSIATNPRKRPRKDVMEDEDDEWVSSILLHQEEIKVQVNSGFRLLKQTKLSKFLNRIGGIMV
jgi:hypothetical protein